MLVHIVKKKIRDHRLLNFTFFMLFIKYLTFVLNSVLIKLF